MKVSPTVGTVRVSCKTHACSAVLCSWLEVLDGSSVGRLGHGGQEDGEHQHLNGKEGLHVELLKECDEKSV